MRFLDATEFAESLRLQDNEFADEICEALVLRDDIEPAYLEMTEELDRIAPDKLQAKALPKLADSERYGRIIEWLEDQIGILNEIRNKLAKNGFDDPGRDVDDLVEDCATDLALAHKLLQDRGLWTEGDFYDALSTALARVPQFDL